MKPFLTHILALILLLGFFSCQNDRGINNLNDDVPTALEAINARGDTLIALTPSKTTSYFLYKGRIHGYEYEMLNRLADHMGVHLKIKLVDNLDSIFHYLNNGEGDLVAYSMTVTNERKNEVAFTDRLYHSAQCLIQKKPNNWRSLKFHETNNLLTRNVLDIGEDMIYVRIGSVYYDRLNNLGDEIGDSLNIIPVEGVKSTFELIELVARGQIKYTVANQEIASIYAAYDNNIDYLTPISMPQKKAWAVRHNSPYFQAAINEWLAAFKREHDYYFIYDKYFNNPKTYKKLLLSNRSIISGSLSMHDENIKKGAEHINWDWRLLAAQIYQESHFDHSQESWMGATGLMQVLPATAEMHGIEDIYDVENNIQAGVAHLKYIEQHFEEMDSVNRIKFTLASYNVGLGHIFDAQRLASYLGKDPMVWENNVAEAILLKSQKEYYQLSICRNGYCRGSEPYNYVDAVMERYHDYVTLFD